jgi:putative two-component system response regulator
VYKDAFAHDIAKDIIVKESGSHFDPAIVAAFLAAEAEFVAIRDRFQDVRLAA